MGLISSSIRSSFEKIKRTGKILDIDFKTVVINLISKNNKGKVYRGDLSKGAIELFKQKWQSITISNAKRNLLGNYDKIKGQYLQV